MNSTEKILAEFDIAFPEVGTSGWIGDPRYPADLCCGANYCSPNCDKRKREAIKAFISTAIAQAIAEERSKAWEGEAVKQAYIQGKSHSISEAYERMRGVIEKLATCGDCNGTGIKDCDKCERDIHKCSRCLQSGEIDIHKDDLLSSLDTTIKEKNPTTLR